MPKGEEIYADFIVASNSRPSYKTAVLEIPVPTTVSCEESFIVFTDGVGTDEFKNDITSVFYKYPPTTSTVAMVLQQKIGGTWTDKDTLDDNNNGTFYALGFIVDEKGNKYIGYKNNWTLTYNLYGVGVYRVKNTETDLSGVTTSYSDEYCLQVYHPNRADGTVKLEFYTNNLRGDITNPYEFMEYKSVNWYNSVRLCGFFGGDKSSYENEVTEYNNGLQQWIKNEQKVIYKLQLKPIPSVIHNFVKTDVVQADLVLITDYNKNNPNRKVQVPVVIDGAYEPKWQKGTLKASVEVNFKLALNNLRKKRC